MTPTLTDKITALLSRQGVREHCIQIEKNGMVSRSTSPRMDLQSVQLIDAAYVEKLEAIVKLVPELVDLAECARMGFRHPAGLCKKCEITTEIDDALKGKV